MNNTNYSSIEIHVFGNTNVKETKLSQHLLLPKNIRAVVGISHFVMPNNMYNIENFTIIKNEKPFTIKQGFYNQDDLTTTLLNTVCDNVDDNTTLGLILTYNTISLKFTIKGVFTNIEFPFVNSPNYLGVTGDISGNNYTFGAGFSGINENDTGIEGTKSPDLGGIPDIFIKLSGLEYPTVNEHKAIGRVPIDVGIGEFLNYKPSEIVYYLLSNQDILKFNVELIDSKGLPLNINNADWSLTIILHFQDKGNQPLPNFPTKGCTTGLCLSDFRNTNRPISRDLYNDLKNLRRKQKKLKKNCRSLF
tara:strand:+ start:1365 stop:2279 length:915 start_codon:yes stop_codon:yes gene_type:complete